MAQTTVSVGSEMAVAMRVMSTVDSRSRKIGVILLDEDVGAGLVVFACLRRTRVEVRKVDAASTAIVVRNRHIRVEPDGLGEVGEGLGEVGEGRVVFAHGADAFSKMAYTSIVVGTRYSWVAEPDGLVEVDNGLVRH